MKAASSSLAAYRQNSVATATPGQLILMLFDGALKFMGYALQGFESSDIIHRNETVHVNLIKTQAIITELQNSLDHRVGGEFARTMSDLYDFMRNQLYTANVAKKPEPVKTVVGLLADIRGAWATMLQQTENKVVTGASFVATAA